MPCHDYLRKENRIAGLTQHHHTNKRHVLQIYVSIVEDQLFHFPDLNSSLLGADEGS